MTSQLYLSLRKAAGRNIIPIYSARIRLEGYIARMGKCEVNTTFWLENPKGKRNYKN